MITEEQAEDAASLIAAYMEQEARLSSPDDDDPPHQRQAQRFAGRILEAAGCDGNGGCILCGG